MIYAEILRRVNHRERRAHEKCATEIFKEKKNVSEFFTCAFELDFDVIVPSPLYL